MLSKLNLDQIPIPLKSLPIPLSLTDKEKTDDLEKFKVFVLFKLAELQKVHLHQPSKAESTLNELKRAIAKYQPNTYLFPSPKTIEGKIKGTLIRQKTKLNIEKN